MRKCALSRYPRSRRGLIRSRQGLRRIPNRQRRLAPCRIRHPLVASETELPSAPIGCCPARGFVEACPLRFFRNRQGERQFNELNASRDAAGVKPRGNALSKSAGSAV